MLQDHFSVNDGPNGNFSPFSPIDFTVSSGFHTVYCRLALPDSPARGMLVMLNGAVDRSRTDLPIFQRSSWSDDLSSHYAVLFCEDPTLHLSPSLALGWGLGSIEESGVEAIHKVSNWVRSSLVQSDLLTSNTLAYFGSSAGGFQALQLASLEPSSGALAINPQIRMLDYYHPQVASALWAAFGTESYTEAYGQFGNRTAFSISSFASSNCRARILINTFSGDDMARDLPNLLLELSSRKNFNGFVDLRFYCDPNGGHNPPSRDATIFEIKDFLSIL